MKSRTVVAKALAAAHRRADPETKLVKFFPDAQADGICLLEVTAATPTSGEVLSFSFPPAPAKGVDYPSTVILLSPEEWQEVLGGKLALPSEWNLASAEDL